MKCVCITTREDVLTGMRLAGIEGSLVVGREDAIVALVVADYDGANKAGIS